MRRLVASLRRKRDEDGVSIIEVVVAAVLTLIILTSSTIALSQIMNTQSSNEARNRAVGIAQDHISKAAVTPFSKLGFKQSVVDAPQIKGGFGGISTYNDEKIKIVPEDAEVFDTPAYEEVRVGQTDLRVFTYVTTVAQNSFDGTVGNFDTTRDIAPKRVTVKVEWDTSDGTSSVVRSVIRYANPVECAPLYALTDPNSSNIPEGCK